MTISRLDLQLRAMLALAGAGCLVVGGDRAAQAQGAQPSAEAACFPACRSGFVCSKGQCISRCNPLCATDETCTATGECVPSRGLTVPSAGQPAPPVTAIAPTSSPASTSAVHVHDGFYLRLGIGLGGASFAGEVTSPNPALDGAGFEGRAVAIPVEVAIGGTPAPGVVVGLGSYASVWPLPHNKLKDFGQSIESDGGSITVASSGPFVDWYFRPAEGLHAQAAITFATATVAKSTDPSARYLLPWRDFSGSGWSLVTGLGWETWIGDQWSAGVLGRIQYGQVSLKSSDGIEKIPSAFAVIAAMATFTYH